MSTDIPVAPKPQIEPGKPWPRELWPDITHVVTEDDTPVESVFHERQREILIDSMYASWSARNVRRFVAMADVGMFYSVDEPPLVPDVLVSFDTQLPPQNVGRHRNSYFIWVYGKSPDVVVEVVSKTPGGEDTTKLAAYARYDVPFYVIYDPLLRLSDQLLRIFELSHGRYVAIDSERMLEQLGLSVVLEEGLYNDTHGLWLRWIDSTGKVLETGAECARLERCRVAMEADRAEAERERAEAAIELVAATSARANAESARADAERQQAIAERERAERFAAKLRELGIDPSSV